MMKIHHLVVGYAADIELDVLMGMDDLSRIVWPATPDAPAYEMPSVEERPDRYVAAILCDEKVVAEAECFRRRIRFTTGEMDVQALASVCTHPQFRNRGYAACVVKEMFKLVDSGKYPLSFWQTGVPEFYLKLGAQLVENRFYNSLHPTSPEKNPFWEKHMMVYPGKTTAWPDGDINILGLGF